MHICFSALHAFLCANYEKVSRIEEERDKAIKSLCEMEDKAKKLKVTIAN